FNWLSNKLAEWRSMEQTYPNRIPEIIREHFKPHSPAFQKKRKGTSVPGETPSYVPHYSLYNCRDTCPFFQSGSVCPADQSSSPSYPELGVRDYSTEDRCLRNQTVYGEQLTPSLFTKNSDVSSVNPDVGDKTASRSAKERHDRHLNKAKHKIMRKLTLSMEQQSKQLAPNDVRLDETRTKEQGQEIPEPKNASFRRYENIPKQAKCGRSLKFPDGDSLILSPEDRLPKNVDNCPKDHMAGQPKSPLKLIANAIKKSIIDPLISSPEGLRKGQEMHSKLPSESTFFNFPHALVHSVSLRNSKNDVQTQELHRLNSAENGLGIRSSDMPHFSSVPREEYSCDDKCVSFPVYSVHSNLSKSPPKSVYSASNVDDVPTLLERFTLKENLWKTAKDDWRARNQKNILYSSLRHHNKNADTILDSAEQRNNVWNLFSSFRNKVDDRVQSTPLMPPVSPCTVFDVDEVLNNSSKEEHLATALRNFFFNLYIHVQAIQRLLEEVEEKQRDLEVYGVQLEKELRGESDSRTQDETQLLHEWFELVLEKNKLMRYESELLIIKRVAISYAIVICGQNWFTINVAECYPLFYTYVFSRAKVLLGEHVNLTIAYNIRKTYVQVYGFQSGGNGFIVL
uniref:BMERB domain-containing protein n=1 Tax=Varanus komodoensis TaxID=61221 RepID=A0A8D2LJ48_VARKO